MQVGDLVTWKLDTYDNNIPLEIGVVVGDQTTFKRRKKCVWVKFINGQHSHRKKTLCRESQLVLVEEIKKKLDKI